MTGDRIPEPPPTPRATLGELARAFLSLGLTAFGGPAAHVALMDEAFVQRRRWLSRDRFLELLAASQLLPGPNSTELALHIGQVHRGVPGLLVAGACFVLPSALMAAGLAWLYSAHGRLPAVDGMLAGMRPVVFAVVALAMARFARTVMTTPRARVLAVAALGASLAGGHELVVLAGAGAIAAAFARPRSATALAALVPAMGAAAAVPFGLWAMFLFFLKVGAVLYGSGYVLLAFMRADLVERWGWITDRQLLDAITVGQMTPGPVFTTATFVGWVLAGPAGAALATVGIFLPAFVLVAASGPLLALLRRLPAARAAIDGVAAASLALLAAVCAQLAREALVDLPSVVLASCTGVLMWRTRVNPAWWMLAGALIGLVAGIVSGQRS